MKRLLAGFVVAVCVFAAVPAGAVVRKSAAFYGDSLMYETRPVLATKMGGGWVWSMTAYPGQGACVILRAMQAELPGTHPDRVTIETHGGALGDCYTPAEQVNGSPEHAARFRSDVRAMFALATSVSSRVTYVVVPPERTAQLQAQQDTNTAIAVDEAARAGVRVSYSGRTALGGKKWRGTMPCKPTETPLMGCTAGQITVRAPDGVHFCPAGFTWTGCPVYSSGAARYGAAIAAATKAR